MIELVERAYLARVQLSGYAPELVWVLGHMRSGSTLLTHVIASHRSAISAGERNRPYTSALDLDRAVAEVHAAHLSVSFRARYVVDQINHDRFVADERLLVHPRVRPVFLVREPAGAIGSMWDTFERTRGWSLERCFAAYVARLDTLARQARTIGARARWLTYEDLTVHTERTLVGLGRWLGITLTRRYDKQPFTARRGDKSVRILAGQILPPEPPVRALPDAHLALAREAYERTIDALAKNVRSARRG